MSFTIPFGSCCSQQDPFRELSFQTKTRSKLQCATFSLLKAGLSKHHACGPETIFSRNAAAKIVRHFTVCIGIIVIPTDLSKAGNKHDARINPDICHCGTRGGCHGAIDVCPPAPNRANTLPRELSDIAPASPLLLAWFQRKLP